MILSKEVIKIIIIRILNGYGAKIDEKELYNDFDIQPFLIESNLFLPFTLKIEKVFSIEFWPAPAWDTLKSIDCFTEEVYGMIS